MQSMEGWLFCIYEVIGPAVCTLFVIYSYLALDYKDEDLYTKGCNIGDTFYRTNTTNIARD